MLLILKRGIVLIFIITIPLFFSTCENPTDSQSTVLEFNFDSTPDSLGNLIIINQLDESLLLYHQGNLLKEIPANYDNFLIQIQNELGNSSNLKVWKKNDVEDINNPNDSNIFRNWHVILSNTTNSQDHISWIISDFDSDEPIGYINVMYSDLLETDVENPYNVDIYLQTPTGSKIASIQPGTQDYKIYMNYGLYYLHFMYWISDPNNSDGKIIIGWYQLPPDSVILLNITNNSIQLDIPTFNESNIGRYGQINIINNSENTIRLYANGLLLEYYMNDSEGEFASYLNPNDSYLYNIQIGHYWFEAINLNNGEVINQIFDIDIVDIETWDFYGYNWVIEEAEFFEYFDFEINNTTEFNYTMHSYLDDSYLGKYINQNSTEFVSINSTINSIKLIDSQGENGVVFYPMESNLSIYNSDLQPIDELNLISKFTKEVFEISECNSSIIDTLNNDIYYYPAKIIFHDNSISLNGIDLWNWDFGNGYFLNYNEYINNIESTYNESGLYQVSLNLSSNLDNTQYSEEIYIQKKPIKIIFPNCSVGLNINNSYNIIWDYNSDILNDNQQIFIKLISENEEHDIGITNIENLSYLWHLNNNINPNSNYKILIELIDVDYFDKSDESFTIYN